MLSHGNRLISCTDVIEMGEERWQKGVVCGLGGRASD